VNVGYALTKSGEYKSTFYNIAEDVERKAYILLTILVDI